MNFNEPQLGGQPGSDSDDEQDEGEKKGPVMYTCIHKNDPTSCTLWDQHRQDPSSYLRVDAQTPCHFCGHRGTLRAVR